MILETEQLIKEIDRAKARLEKAPVVDQKKEFLANVYPLLRMIAEAHGLRLDEQENALSDILSNSEPIITPELSLRLVATYRMGIDLAADLLKDTPPTSEELSAKARAFHEAATMMVEIVEQFTIEPDEDEDEGDEEDDDGEDGDEQLEDESAVTEGVRTTEIIDLRGLAAPEQPDPAETATEADEAPEEISL